MQSNVRRYGGQTAIFTATSFYFGPIYFSITQNGDLHEVSNVCGTHQAQGVVKHSIRRLLGNSVLRPQICLLSGLRSRIHQNIQWVGHENTKTRATGNQSLRKRWSSTTRGKNRRDMASTAKRNSRRALQSVGSHYTKNKMIFCLAY